MMDRFSPLEPFYLLRARLLTWRVRRLYRLAGAARLHGRRSRKVNRLARRAWRLQSRRPNPLRQQLLHQPHPTR